ncbi:MAG: ribosomal protein S18-alanine N-acetyltransferase [Candidatus Aminicenantes bacterium]|nr:ribosomal protein S18-alanine N-acetyltransferase [Candidatus Aminicenantes bacterium]
MEEDDIPSVLEIENVSFQNPWQASTFSGEIVNRGISYPYVIMHRIFERIIGYIIYWKIQEEVQISNFAIHPDFRGKGIGEAVMRRVIKAIQRDGGVYVFLEVRPSNLAARSLYKKLEFEILGARKGYYHTPVEDALIMGRPL